MTIETTAQTIIYDGNDSVTIFPYTWRIQVETDIKVVLIDSNNANIDVDPSEYSIDGIGDAGGGNVTYPLVGSPLATGMRLAIVPATLLTQETDLPKQGAYYADTVEAMVDRSTLQSQKISDELSRTFILPIGVSSVTTPEELYNNILTSESACEDYRDETQTIKDATEILRNETEGFRDEAEIIIATAIRDWDNTKTYTNENYVIYNGILYKSLQNGNINKTPSSEPTWWTIDFTFGSLKINKKFNTQPNSATISSGAITYTGAYMILDGEGGAPDTLTTITGGSEGDILILRIKDTANPITISSDVGNIYLTFGRNIILTALRDCLVLNFINGQWKQICSSLEYTFKNSRATNGYTYLPNGLIFQWATGVNTVGVDTVQTINYPITFPNAILHGCVTTKSTSSGGNGDAWFQEYTNTTTSSMDVIAQSSGTGSVSGGVTPKIFVIGY